jgi:hypothetical protein
MLTSFYCFASDLADAGPEAVLDDLQRAGVDGVTLAAAYHAARDVFPHARGRRIRFLRGGEVHFRPDPALWRDAALAPLGGREETLGDLVSAAAARRLHVDAWTVFLHVDREHDLPAGVAEETCFGDPLPTQLCPANPDVRRYAVTLAREVARRGVRAVVAESLHHHPFGHGYHHERRFVALPPVAEALLDTCFCRHCSADDGVRARAAAIVEEGFAADDGDGPPAERDALDALLDGHLTRREQRVASLVAEVAAACRAEGAELVFLDASGAAKGYATGRPEGGPATEVAWRLGVDLGAVARAADGIGVIAYAAEVARVALDLDAYRTAAGSATALEMVLRPSRPDCTDAANLRAKLDAGRERDVRAAGFYHYGLAPAAAIERVRVALA